LDHSALVVDAAATVLRRRQLWALGFLAWLPAILGGLGLQLTLPATGRWLAELKAASAGLPETGGQLNRFILVVVLVMAAGLVTWLVSLLGEASLIWAVHSTQGDRELGLGPITLEARAFMARMIAVDTILFLPLFLLALGAATVFTGTLVATVAAANTAGSLERMLAILGLGSLTAGLLLCLMLPVAVLIGLGRWLAFRAVVMDGRGARRALRDAWLRPRGRWLDVGIVAVLTWGLRYVLTLPYRLAALIMALLTAGITLPAAFPGGSQPGLSPLVAAAGWIVALLGAVAGSAVHAFISTIWTMAYGQWASPPAPMEASG
jgi:hypothetical protein